MFQQFNLYIIIGLLVTVLALSGSFYLYHRVKSAEITELVNANAAYAITVDIQKDTISKMEKDAQLLAAANRTLSHSLIDSESAFVDEWSAINALDLESEAVLANPEELEKKVNEEFRKSIDRLKDASGVRPCNSSVELCNK